MVSNQFLFSPQIPMQFQAMGAMNMFQTTSATDETTGCLKTNWNLTTKPHFSRNKDLISQAEVQCSLVSELRSWQSESFERTDFPRLKICQTCHSRKLPNSKYEAASTGVRVKRFQGFLLTGKKLSCKYKYKFKRIDMWRYGDTFYCFSSQTPGNSQNKSCAGKVFVINICH